MSEWYEKTIGRKKVQCKIVKARARNTGRVIEREMCYEIKPDGSRGRLVSSKIAGTSHYTLKQLREMENRRSPKSRARDEATTSKTVISYKDPRANSWAENPDVRRRIDIKGVDTARTPRYTPTPRRTKTPSRTRTKKPTTPKIKCVKEPLPSGRIIEKCYDENGKIVSRHLL